MNVIWFANDTTLTETETGYSVQASALDLPVEIEWPDQLVVNGYSYTSVGGCGPLQLYRRDSDGTELVVNRDDDAAAMCAACIHTENDCASCVDAERGGLE